MDYVYTDGNCSKTEVTIDSVNHVQNLCDKDTICICYDEFVRISHITDPFLKCPSLIKHFHSQIGQVQKSLESCMDKQTIEFQTQVPQLTIPLLVLLPKAEMLDTLHVKTNDLFV